MLLDNLFSMLGADGTSLVCLTILAAVATASVAALAFPVRPFHGRLPPGR